MTTKKASAASALLIGTRMQKILEHCKGSITLKVNEQRAYNQHARAQLEHLDQQGAPLEFTQEVRDKIIATDTLIDLVIYPGASADGYQIVHHDLEQVLAEALEVLELKD